MRLEEWQKYLEEQFVDSQATSSPELLPHNEEPVLTELTGEDLIAAPQTISHAIVTEATLPISDAESAEMAAAAQNDKQTNRRQSLSLYPILTSESTPSDSVPNAGVSTRSLKPLKFASGAELDAEIPEFESFVARRAGETPKALDAGAGEETFPLLTATSARIAAPRLNKRRQTTLPSTGSEPPAHWFALQQVATSELATDKNVTTQRAARSKHTAQRLLDPLISLSDAAALLQVSLNQVQRLASQGHVKLIKCRNTSTKRSERTAALPVPASRRLLLSDVMRYRRDKVLQLGFAAELEFSEPGVSYSE